MSPESTGVTIPALHAKRVTAASASSHRVLLFRYDSSGLAPHLTARIYVTSSDETGRRGWCVRIGMLLEML